MNVSMPFLRRYLKYDRGQDGFRFSFGRATHLQLNQKPH